MPSLTIKHDPEEHMNRLIDSLKEIQDRDFIKNYMTKI